MPPGPASGPWNRSGKERGDLLDNPLRCDAPATCRKAKAGKLKGFFFAAPFSGRGEDRPFSGRGSRRTGFSKGVTGTYVWHRRIYRTETGPGNPPGRASEAGIPRL